MSESKARYKTGSQNAGGDPLSPPQGDGAKKLTNKQRVFIDAYLETFSGAEAARRAGYSQRTARQMGRENLSKPYIKAEIDARLEESRMSADEALQALSEIARGDIGEFMDVSTVGWNISLVDENEDGTYQKKKSTRLIKKIKQKVTTIQGGGDDGREIIETEIELHDPLSAIDKILRVAGKYKDSLDLTTKGEKLPDYRDVILSKLLPRKSETGE
jgi:phage terminase small subunit